MRYYIIAGEASGDLHAANLVKALRAKDENAVFRGWGGDLMQDAGVEIVKHYKETAFMGFLAVVINLPTILKNIKYCKEDILSYKPDVIILVDYAGFNLRMAKFAKENKIKVCYYIAPKVWAWKEGRIEKLRKYVDYLYCILPFEKDYFQARGINAFYAGNPLLDAIEARPNKEEKAEDFKKTFGLDTRKIIALLPGSRKQEIATILPTMLNSAKFFPDYQFVLAAAPGISDDFYQKVLNTESVAIVRNATYRLLAQSESALVASGTATLETAILNIPQVVCYNAKGSWLAHFIGKYLIKTDYISLVNLILDKQAVEELIILNFTTKNVVSALKRTLNENRKRILEDYSILRTKIGAPGVSQRCAEQLMKDVK